MAFPNTPLLDTFPSDIDPLNGTGNWSATKTSTNAPNNMKVVSGTAMAVTAYGSAVWAVSYATPLEFYLTKQNTGGDDYYYWNVQPGSIGGSGTLDAYIIHVPSTSTVSVIRTDNDSDTVLFTATSITHAAGDQWGISHAADGTITLYQNGVVRGAGAVDLTYTSGYLGFATSWTSAGGVDDLGGGSLLGAPSIAPDWIRGAFPFMPMADRIQGPTTRATLRLGGNQGPGPQGSFERRYLVPRLHPIAMGVTHSGASSLTTNLDITTAATRIATGASSATITLTTTTVGKLTARGASTSTYTLGITTVGKLTARSASTSTYTLSLGTVGKLTAKAASTSTYTFSATTAGAKVTFGATSSTYTLSRATAGTRIATGATASTYTLNRTIVGKLTARAASVSTYTLSRTTVGKLTAKAASTSTYTLGITTAGAIGAATYFGASSLTLNLSRVTVAKLTAKAATASTYTFNRTTVGKLTARTASTLTITLNRTTAASRTRFGATSLTETLTIGTVGKTFLVGSASMTVTLTTSTVGRLASFGSSTMPITLTIETRGSAPELLEETLAGWIATAVTGHTAAATVGRVRNPTTGSIA